MPIPFSTGFDLITALDVRNVEAHLAEAVAGCTACATTARPGPGCPAGLAAQIHNAATAPLTAIEIIDGLLALRRTPQPDGA
ncbi:hypothetical protein ABZW96_16975 [Nocardia sp. NPDC004168]|uniref:hypothetical protein n=1 Tax=Nocardia TaxID=1817 RepID=UPI0033BBD453